LVLRPGSPFAVRNDSYDEIEWYDTNIEKPSKDEIDAKIAELDAAEPMRVLRDLRNFHLKECDWTQCADIRAIRGAEWSAAWDAYRQALRDITNTATPVFNEFNILHGVTWPTPPSA